MFIDIHRKVGLSKISNLLVVNTKIINKPVENCKYFIIFQPLKLLKISIEKKGSFFLIAIDY